MNISVRILQLRGQAHELIRRFPVAVFWQALGIFIGAGLILLRPDYRGLDSGFENSPLFDHLARLVPAVFGAWLTAVTCRLGTDIFPVKRPLPLCAAASGILFVLLACIWYGAEPPSSHLIVGTEGVFLALGFLALFLFERANKAPGLPALLFAAAFSIGTSVLLSLGLILCVAAFWALIVTDADGRLPETTYLFSGLIAYCGWGVAAFLGALPNADARYEFPAATQKLLLYLFFPVYLLLLLVLYLYVGKIIGAGEMPVGTMNWYASFALLGFTFFFGTLAVQTRLPLFARFLKWGLVLFLPILAVQLYGVYLRYEAYGLTTPRYTSMICTFCGIYALTVAFLRRKPQQIYLCAAILALIFSLTPLNVIDVPLHSQETRLSQILTEHNLLQDGTFVMRDDISPDVIDEITDIACYMREDSSPLAEEILDKVWRIHEPRQEKHFDISFDPPGAMDIAGYSTLLQFDMRDVNPDGSLTIKRADGNEECIDLHPYAARVTDYVQEHDTVFLPREMQEYRADDYLIHFDSVSFNRTTDGTVDWLDTNGFVLIR